MVKSEAARPLKLCIELRPSAKRPNAARESVRVEPEI
jgi:hypothetical protein